MQTSNAGIALIKKAEGLRLKAYRCPAGVWTVGYGSTGPHVYEGLSITACDAETRLIKDLSRFEEGVLQTLRDRGAEPPTQNQFDALVSFTFNLGLSAWRKSTLLRRIVAKDHIGAAAQFSRWNMASGRVLPGLVVRRAAEAALYSTASTR